MNLFLNRDGNIKLGDLGVSKIVSSAGMMQGTRIGTPLYLAPELIEQKPYNFKVDVWGLGCVLYYLATLDAPFKGDNLISLGYSIVHQQPKPIQNGYSENLQMILQQMLIKDPNKRPSFKQILENFPNKQSFLCTIHNKNENTTLQKRKQDQQLKSSDTKQIQTQEKEISQVKQEKIQQKQEEKIKKNSQTNTDKYQEYPTNGKIRVFNIKKMDLLNNQKENVNKNYKEQNDNLQNDYNDIEQEHLLKKSEQIVELIPQAEKQIQKEPMNYFMKSPQDNILGSEIQKFSIGKSHLSREKNLLNNFNRPFSANQQQKIRFSLNSFSSAEKKPLFFKQNQQHQLCIQSQHSQQHSFQQQQPFLRKTDKKHEEKLDTNKQLMQFQNQLANKLERMEIMNKNNQQQCKNLVRPQSAAVSCNNFFISNSKGNEANLPNMKEKSNFSGSKPRIFKENLQDQYVSNFQYELLQPYQQRNDELQGNNINSKKFFESFFNKQSSKFSKSNMKAVILKSSGENTIVKQMKKEQKDMKLLNSEESQETRKLQFCEKKSKGEYLKKEALNFLQKTHQNVEKPNEYQNLKQFTERKRPETAGKRKFTINDLK